MKKHQYNAGYPLGHCIHCGRQTGLDPWQLVDVPRDMAKCDKSNVNASIIEWFTRSYNCLAPNNLQMRLG